MEKEGLLEKEYLVSSEEMREYDKNTIEYFGVPSMVLMERAALAVAEEIEERFPGGGRVLVAAGSGNNGGDGIAVGRILKLRGFAVDFYLAGEREKCSRETEEQIRIIGKYGYSLQNKMEDKEYDIIVDALFGIGLSRELKGGFAETVRKINESGAFICSIDIPSGIHTDSGQVMGEAVKAALTVTFGWKKLGHMFYPGSQYGGKIVCRDIGITRESFLKKAPRVYTYRGDAGYGMPWRNGGGNKGTFGKVLVVAGSVNMSGACELCARAAYRTGAGMVKVITPEENRIIVQSGVPEALLSTYRSEGEISGKLHNILEEGMKWADCIVIGPGIGTGEKADAILKEVLEGERKPLVIDADGLNLLARDQELKRCLENRNREAGRGQVILTPHLAEFARLHGCTLDEARRDILHKPGELADRYGCIVVCKDARTAVAVPAKEEIYMNTSGNDGMATAGMGDVLAGVIGGLLAQGMEAEQAAVLGVYIHGTAGDRAAEQKGRYALMAGDVVECLGSVTRRKGMGMK